MVKLLSLPAAGGKLRIDLPIVLNSVRGFWKAAGALKDCERESAVLRGFAVEEAAKILILLDIVRCPKKEVSNRIGAMVSWFYDHLARIIYVEATETIHATDINYLRDAIQNLRKNYYLEGDVGEYIFPNWELYTRERQIYSDIEGYADGFAGWSAPDAHGFMDLEANSSTIRLVEAMSALGLFSVDALMIVSKLWGRVSFHDTQDYDEARRLIWATLEEVDAAGLMPPTASQDDANLLARFWQLPMYALDLSRVSVSLEELKARQEGMLWSEIGYP